MDKNDNYQKMQFGLEQRKVELLEQEATVKMARKRLHIAKEQVQLKADILRQRAQLIREGVPQDEIDSALPVPNHTDDS